MAGMLALRLRRGTESTCLGFFRCLFSLSFTIAVVVALGEVGQSTL